MAIVDVVKYNGPADTFVWKYPSVDLGTWTQLIVNESQEAVFFKGGRALDVFGPGRHTLDTANLPLLNKIINLPFGGKSPFTAEIWYINKLNVLDIKWGTPTPIQIQDPKYKVMVPVRSFGHFGIRIENSKQFMVKLVGTMPAFKQQDIVNHFRGLYITKVKDSISGYLVHKNVSILEINAYLVELSNYIKQKIEPFFAEYGIQVVNFYVNDINVPEDDEAVKTLKKALAKRAEMDIIGYNYQQERSFDSLEGAAKNQGSFGSGFMGAGIGLGMGAAAGRSFGMMMQDVGKVVQTTGTTLCPKCHTSVNQDSLFCFTCGHKLKEMHTQRNTKITCSKCSFAYKPDVKFCPECGDKYNPCPKCGADLNEGTKKCTSCGAEMSEPCQKCGHISENSKTKFCPECGTTMEKKCPACDISITGSPKFCPECGQKLT
ncbi:SPFH domain-containing protein [Brucepastera parasyntrophica]|uniref:SPFH domain-containing protein n=1 Tax=Brucepastera parasyntrophica TaxID=2880008 RepID=UPI00210E66FF|nr:SPFH domain-containing protein [Brucepastera parasyntrophica]ULQ59185.1 SPFH domain-containing protein [Brucepastera parasyntrophica]